MSRIRCFLIAVVLSVVSFAAMAMSVDVNTADAQTLASALNGVGASKAEAIVNHRDKNGPFNSVEDLLQVKGIGQKILDKNRHVIKVNSSTSE